MPSSRTCVHPRAAELVVDSPWVCVIERGRDQRSVAYLAFRLPLHVVEWYCRTQYGNQDGTIPRGPSYFAFDDGKCYVDQRCRIEPLAVQRRSRDELKYMRGYQKGAKLIHRPLAEVVSAIVPLYLELACRKCGGRGCTTADADETADTVTRERSATPEHVQGREPSVPLKIGPFTTDLDETNIIDGSRKRRDPDASRGQSLPDVEGARAPRTPTIRDLVPQAADHMCLHCKGTGLEPNVPPHAAADSAAHRTERGVTGAGNRKAKRPKQPREEIGRPPDSDHAKAGTSAVHRHGRHTRGPRGDVVSRAPTTDAEVPAKGDVVLDPTDCDWEGFGDDSDPDDSCDRAQLSSMQLYSLALRESGEDMCSQVDPLELPPDAVDLHNEVMSAYLECLVESQRGERAWFYSQRCSNCKAETDRRTCEACVSYFDIHGVNRPLILG
ncbi:hypothetical protein DFJ74DRAFT_650707 [Hyaloraphidium curvatum]|nr:hypothetical protein DFJ74DRAFT_650707 [Hyaloraphidium curvatum]